MKSGDKVKCIDDDDFVGELVRDTTYTIKDIYDDGKSFTLEDCTTIRYRKNRFVISSEGAK